MPKKPPKFKLYWVETDDHSEDWFVMARTAREARRFHEDQEGYDPGDAVATRVKTLGDEGRTGWPSHEELVGFGLTIVQSETPRLVEYMGVRYGEGTLEHEIEVNTALREQAQRLYGVPELGAVVSLEE